MFNQDDAGLLTKHEHERARSIAASAEEEAAADDEPVLAATLEEPDMLRAWLGYFREINTEANLELEEPEQRALGEPDGLDGNAYATAAKPGVGQDESLLHASANKPEQCAHGEPNGLEGNTSVTAGTEAGIASGFSDAPPETSIEALPTTRCEIGALLPASSMLPGGGYEISSDKIPFGNTLEPDRLSFAATLVATNALLPEGETPTSLVAIPAAVAATHVLLPEGETPTSLVAIAAAVATGGEPVEPEQHAAADELEQCALGEFNRLDGNAYATAAEPSGRADELLQGSANELEQRAHGDPDGLNGNAYATAAETGVGQDESSPHASTNKPEQRAHAEPNGLESNASATAGTEAGIASGFSGAPLETSIEALPTTRRELGMPLPAGDTPAKLANAPRPPAPTGPWMVKRTCRRASAHAPAGAGAVRELAVADAVTTGARVTLAHIQPCRDGANGFVAAVHWGLDAVVRHVQPVIIGFLFTYLAYLAAARAVSTADTTARVVPGFAVPHVFASHYLNWLHDSEAYLAGAGAARELGVSTTIGPLAATVSSRRASLLPAAWAPPPAPAQSCSSSCAFPASSMSPEGVCEISSDEIVFAGDTLECGLASNCDDSPWHDSPGRGGADGTGAEEPNYVSDKADQYQKPGGFSLATGRPPGDTAAGALSTGKLESRRGPPGGAAAGAISAGALKLESTGRAARRRGRWRALGRHHQA